MRTIYKYTLEQVPEQVIELPVSKTARAMVLHLADQLGQLTFWVLVPAAPYKKEKRTFYVVGTGHNLPAKARTYHGTVLLGNGLVWHVFEKA